MYLLPIDLVVLCSWTAWELFSKMMGFIFVSSAFYSFQTPEVTLQIASRLPAMEASDNAFQGSFFYQVLQIESQM